MTATTSATSELRVLELELEPARVCAAWRAAWVKDAQCPMDLDSKLASFYSGNPAGTTRVLVLASGPASEILGMVALAPRRVSVDTQYCTFAMPFDFVIRADHRYALPALLLQRGAQRVAAASYSGTYALPGPRAAAIFKRLGGMRVITRPRWVRVLSHSDILEQYVAVWLARLLGRAADASSLVRDAWRLWRGKLAVTAMWVDNFDARFDALWNRIDRHAVLIGERDCRFLNWRFPDAYVPQRKILTVVNASDGALRMYIIGSVRGGIFHVDDMLTDVAERNLGCVLVHALRALRKSGVSRVSMRLLAPPMTYRALRRLGFRARDCDTVFINTVSALQDKVAACEVYLTTADEDVQTT